MRKHGISFDEATTVFGDPLAITYPDPEHSVEEDRFLTFGHSSQGSLIVVSHTDRGDKIRPISVRRMTRKREEIMSKLNDELKPEYDLKSLGKGIRGKYYGQYQKDTNVVVIDPDLSEAFPNTKSVNDALREMLESRHQSAT